MSLFLLTPVTVEPVGLVNAQTYLRLDCDDLDYDLASALSTARAEAELFTGMSFAPQAWRVVRDGWWTGGLALPMPPVNTVSAVSYLDTDAEWQTIGASNYTVDSGVLYFADAFTLPDLSDRGDAVRVDYSTGDWTVWGGLPDGIKRAIYMLAGSTFDALAEQPETLRDRAFALLTPYRRNTGFASAGVAT